MAESADNTNPQQFGIIHIARNIDDVHFDIDESRYRSPPPSPLAQPHPHRTRQLPSHALYCPPASSACHQVVHEGDNRREQQYVNEKACDMEDDETKYPEHEENKRDSPQHNQFSL